MPTSPPVIQLQAQPNDGASASSATQTDPYWEETVARAIDEFSSDDPEVRRSAVMLLGKYPVPPAREIITQALRDSNADVRQAALVSVLEEPGQFHRPFAEPAIQLLNDPSVSIRRIASSSIPILLQGYPLVLRPGSQFQREIPPHIVPIIQQAFQDEDVSVRRNMVTHYPVLRIDLPEETIVSLLHDADDEVAIHTVRWGLPLLSPQGLARELEQLIAHENPTFRLELVRALGTGQFSGASAIVGQLLADPHPPVAMEAMLWAFAEQPSVDLYRRMMEHYRVHGGDDAVGQRLIAATRLLGNEAEAYLREWMNASDPAHRQRAVQYFLSQFEHSVNADFLLTLLSDPAPGVRQQAMRTLRQYADQLSDADIRQLVTNPHSEVRETAASVVSLLPPTRAEGALMELLLDETPEVRLAALQQIGRLQIPGWEEIMSISLQVEDPLTSRAALSWLIRHPNAETLQLLRSFLDENPGSPLRAQIETHLKRHARQVEESSSR